MRITGGEHRGRRLSPSRGAGLRPTTEKVRQAIFSILGPDAVEGRRVLDLYSGTGVFGIEALSRGASWVDFVEADARRAQQIGESLRSLRLEGRSRVVRAKVLGILKELSGGYDLVFADPPYDLDEWKLIMSTLAKGNLVNQDAAIVAEHRSSAVLADKYSGFIRQTIRKYGDTAVSIYRTEAQDG